LARFQKPFAAAGPQKRPSIPCSCSKTHAAQAEPRWQAAWPGQAKRPSHQLLLLLPRDTLLAGQAKKLAAQQVSRSKLDQVQKGKKITVTVRRLQKSYSSATPQQRKFHLRTFPCLDENGDEIKKKSSFFRVEPSSRSVKTAPHPQGTVVASRTSRPHSQIPAELNA